MKEINILIVEDEVIIAMDLKRALRKLNYHITNIVSSPKEVMNSISQNEPDLIMMDINLGYKKDGIDIVKDIQKIKNIPILYLTSYSDKQTMDRAFETNPVGYLNKPFKIKELKSIIELAIYKINKLEYKNINENHTKIGCGYFFDLKNQRLYYQSIYIKLSDKERKLLFLLISTSEKYLSKSELEQKIWLNNIPSTSSLKTLVYRIKRKLNCDIVEAFLDGYKLVYKKELA